ncbi:MAG: hypothetical protein E7363_01965 [Clostridiales bacterium]|nr:hypothetical protein [Clostridiales bacterium]
MHCGKASKITSSTFYNLWKLTVYRLLAFTIAIGMGAAIVLPAIRYILESTELKFLLTTVKNLGQSIIHGEDLSAYGPAIQDGMKDFGVLILSKKGNIALVCLGVVVALFFGEFLKGLSSFTYGNAVNDYMSTMSNQGFFRCFFRQLPRAVMYQLVQTVLKTVYALLTFAAMLYTFIGLVPQLQVFTLGLVYVIAIVMFALYYTVMNGFMPAIVVDNKSIGSALKTSFAQLRGKKRFFSLFGTYVVSLVVCEALFVIFGLITFGVGFLVLPTVISMYFTALSFVFYYHFTDRKFYLDYDHIVIPKALRKEESLLNEMDV